MLGALGEFLATIVSPLNQMGQAIQMNAAAFSGYVGIEDKAMSTVAFAAFAGPWIEELGDIAVGAGTFLTSLVAFLDSIAGLL
jgi:hypothetical protein